MKVYVIGNPLVAEDSAPLRLLPKLQKEFPHIAFEEADPNENFVPEDGSIIVDTVQRIERVTLFDSLDAFEQTSSVSPHDYDLFLHLRLLLKLGKIRSVTIVGIPVGATDDEVLSAMKRLFTST